MYKKGKDDIQDQEKRLDPSETVESSQEIFVYEYLQKKRSSLSSRPIKEADRKGLEFYLVV